MYGIVEMSACLLTTADATAYLKKESHTFSMCLCCTNIDLHLYFTEYSRFIQLSQKKRPGFTFLLLYYSLHERAQIQILLACYEIKEMMVSITLTALHPENVIFFFHPVFTYFQLHSIRLLCKLMRSQPHPYSAMSP